MRLKMPLGELQVKPNFEESLWKSGGGPPHSKTLARVLAVHGKREAFWSAPALWRFFRLRLRKTSLAKMRPLVKNFTKWFDPLRILIYGTREIAYSRAGRGQRQNVQVVLFADDRPSRTRIQRPLRQNSTAVAAIALH
jgi:hypothetical protein